MRPVLIKVFYKLIQLVISLFLLSFLVFWISRLAPGDPLRSYYGDGVERMSAVQQQQARENLGLDRSIAEQYGIWIQNAFHGDFGISFKYKQKVTAVIGNVYQNSLLLGGLSFLFTFLLALFLGIFCAWKEDRLIDRILCKVGVVSSCIPSFWAALILILIFSVNLQWLPSGGAYDLDGTNRIRHLILPLTVLIGSHLWYYAYLVRNKLCEELKKDYVLFCRAKGLGWNVILWKHCLKNILPSYISMMAVSVPHLVGGTYLVEQIFSYPGLGLLCFESAKYHDYNMLMVLCLITGTAVICAGMLAQILSERLNPAIKQNGVQTRGGDHAQIV